MQVKPCPAGTPGLGSLHAPGRSQLRDLLLSRHPPMKLGREGHAWLWCDPNSDPGTRCDGDGPAGVGATRAWYTCTLPLSRGLEGRSCEAPTSSLPSSPQPMKPLKATATTSQPVLTIQQIETIFYKIQDIYEIHKEFYDSLCPKVQHWDSSVTMGHLFQKLVSAGGELASPTPRSCPSRDVAQEGGVEPAEDVSVLVLWGDADPPTRGSGRGGEWLVWWQLRPLGAANAKGSRHQREAACHVPAHLTAWPELGSPTVCAAPWAPAPLFSQDCLGGWPWKPLKTAVQRRGPHARPWWDWRPAGHRSNGAAPRRPASWACTRPSWTTTRLRWRRPRSAARATTSSTRSRRCAGPAGGGFSPPGQIPRAGTGLSGSTWHDGQGPPV